MATFASGQLTNNSDNAVLLMDSKLAEACGDRKQVGTWSKEFRQDAEMIDGEAAAKERRPWVVNGQQRIRGWQRLGAKPLGFY